MASQRQADEGSNVRERVVTRAAVPIRDHAGSPQQMSAQFHQALRQMTSEPLGSRQRSDARAGTAPAGPSRTRTVVHYVDSNTYGGCEAVVLLLLSGLDRKLWRPMLFYHEGVGIERLLAEAARNDVPCRPVPRITNRNLPAALIRFAGELRRAQASVFHMHLNWPLGCRYATTAALVARVPAVVSTAHLCAPVNDIRFGAMRMRLRTAIVDRYVAVSSAMTAGLRDTLGIPEAKIRVIQNGIDVGAFGRPCDPALRAQLSGGTNRPLVFTPARLHAQKGHTFLLEAAAQVPDAIFVLAGDGEERPRLEEQAGQLQIADRVRFLGNRQDIPALMACCDLFVLPSLYEGLPLSVLEAMAAGRPVVATAVSGTPEAVIDGVTGLLVPPSDAASLSAAIRRVLSDPELADRIARAGRTAVAEKFSGGAMVSATAGLYEELLQS
jgi:glycosyltransferase involved in cell wall biosynthesis